MSRSRFLADLFKSEAPKLRRGLKRMAGANAEDIVQDSFVKMCAIDTDAIATPSAYLRQTAHNLARNEIRRQRIVPMVGVANPEELGLKAEEPTPAEALEQDDQSALLRREVEKLPAHLSQPLLLAKIDGLTAKEISAKLGLSERTVFRYIAEAIARLHLALTAAPPTKPRTKP